MRAPLLAVLVAVSLGAGCAANQHPQAAAPASQGVKQLIAALQESDAKAAYAMLTDDQREQIDFDQFALMWRQSVTEREQRARALNEGIKGNADLGERASVVYAGGKTVQLRREGGVWKLETAIITSFYAGRPHDAIRVLADALSARDYERVMRILTSRRREAIRAQVDGFTASLVENIDGAVQFIGDDSAEMRWEDGDKRYRIVLRKEGSEWRVDDIHIRTVEPDTDEDPSGPAKQ